MELFNNPRIYGKLVNWNYSIIQFPEFPSHHNLFRFATRRKTHSLREFSHWTSTDRQGSSRTEDPLPDHSLISWIGNWIAPVWNLDDPAFNMYISEGSVFSIEASKKGPAGLHMIIKKINPLGKKKPARQMCRKLNVQKHVSFKNFAKYRTVRFWLRARLSCVILLGAMGAGISWCLHSLDRRTPCDIINHC